MTESNSLGRFLRDRRGRLDPTSLGFPSGRRRTPGLRREEVAQRANISPTWYTWLEQGRGGAPSADVLDRIAGGLMLTEAEREHMFILGLGRPPERNYRHGEGVSPRLQRILDAFPVSPAIIKSPTWDVIAWNQAAAIILTDYSKLPVKERNILRLMFGDTGARAAQDDWHSVARFIVGSLRADASRAHADTEVSELVDELSRISPEFAALWRDNEVTSQSDGIKRLHHPQIGPIDLEFSTFAVDGRPDLSMVIYNPATQGDTDRIVAHIDAHHRIAEERSA